MKKIFDLFVTPTPISILPLDLSLIHSCFLFLVLRSILFTYLKGRIMPIERWKERCKDGETERSSIYCSLLQMAQWPLGLGLPGAKSLKIHPCLPSGWQGLMHMGHLPLPFQVHQHWYQNGTEAAGTPLVPYRESLQQETD